MPEVSVIIPAYNHAAYIAEAVRSVLNQTERDLELIVVDDGSTDHTLHVLAGFSDPRLRILTQSNQGAHAAINRGLAEAAGAYLAILNSDDAYHLRRLEKMLGALQANPALGLAGSHIEVIDEAGRTLGVKHGYRDLEPWPLEEPKRSFRAGDDLRAALLTENYLATTSNYVFRRECYERVGEFRPLRYTHDWDFALRAARSAEIALVEEPLVRYRVHGSNTIRENQAAMIFEICWCLAVHLPAAAREALPAARQQDLLLHSIYTYGFEKVLAVMLLQRLAEDPEQALRLLAPGDAGRAAFLEYIKSRLPQQDAPGARRAAARWLPGLLARVKSALA